ncbi:MAG: M48 family metallopeptidase [Candidatus Omnitrophica bacterium]|nr:M48 family metallopeptidase [Candidatus Omnitrophota bacterium]
MIVYNYYLPAVMVIIIGGYIVSCVIEKLDVMNASPVLPREFEGYYDAEKYQKSQSYLKKTVQLGIIEDTFFTFGVIVFIITGWFNLIDSFARSFQQAPIVTGLIFIGIIYLAYYIFSIPFLAYQTFVIEEKYGFNRTTFKTFIADILKSILLTLFFGTVILSVILWFFSVCGSWAWAYSWIALTVFELFVAFIAPVAIMPLFNKFTPLEEGELKAAITAYAYSQDFKIKGIYKMDASRRSAKSNAFFTGLGHYKRIVLFDTLVTNMKIDELVAILAHEIGHYKHKDIFKGLAVSTASAGLMFFTLSFFVSNKEFFAAFKMENISIYAGLFLFTFLYRPVNDLFCIGTNYISRRFEILADSFSVETYKHPQAMISALKRLSVDNLTNLTPHPLKVFLSYSHPPVLTRIEAIRIKSVSSP